LHSIQSGGNPGKELGIADADSLSHAKLLKRVTMLSRNRFYPIRQQFSMELLAQMLKEC